MVKINFNKSYLTNALNELSSIFLNACESKLCSSRSKDRFERIKSEIIENFVKYDTEDDSATSDVAYSTGDRGKERINSKMPRKRIMKDILFCIKDAYSTLESYQKEFNSKVIVFEKKLQSEGINITSYSPPSIDPKQSVRRKKRKRLVKRSKTKESVTHSEDPDFKAGYHRTRNSESTSKRNENSNSRKSGRKRIKEFNFAESSESAISMDEDSESDNETSEEYNESSEDSEPEKTKSEYEKLIERNREEGLAILKKLDMNEAKTDLLNCVVKLTRLKPDKKKKKKEQETPRRPERRKTPRRRLSSSSINNDDSPRVSYRHNYRKSKRLETKPMLDLSEAAIEEKIHGKDSS